MRVTRIVPSTCSMGEWWKRPPKPPEFPLGTGLFLVLNLPGSVQGCAPSSDKRKRRSLSERSSRPDRDDQHPPYRTQWTCEGPGEGSAKAGSATAGSG